MSDNNKDELKDVIDESSQALLLTDKGCGIACTKSFIRFAVEELFNQLSKNKLLTKEQVLKIVEYSDLK